MHEEYETRISGDREGEVTVNFFQKFSGTENWISGISRLSGKNQQF